jgi:hypothetical protein
MQTATRMRRFALIAGSAAACLAIGPVASPAKAPQAPFVGTFVDTEPISGTVPGDYPCFEGQTGTITGTQTLSGRYNNAPDYFHFAAQETAQYRIDFTDGRYVIGSLSGRLIIEANNESGVNREKDTEVSQERAVVYSQDGTQVGTVRISATFHVTWPDLHGSVDRFRVTCS